MPDAAPDPAARSTVAHLSSARRAIAAESRRAPSADGASPTGVGPGASPARSPTVPPDSTTGGLQLETLTTGGTERPVPASTVEIPGPAEPTTDSSGGAAPAVAAPAGDGGDAGAEAAPGPSDGELSRLDQESEVGSSAGPGGPSATSLDTETGAGSTPTPIPAAGPVPAAAGSPTAAGPAGTVAGAPRPGAATAEQFAESEPRIPDPLAANSAAEFAAQERQLETQQNLVTTHHTEASRGLAEALDAQATAESGTDESSGPAAATAETHSGQPAVGSDPADAASADQPAEPENPADVQQEAGAAVDASGSDETGEAAADALGGSGGGSAGGGAGDGGGDDAATGPVAAAPDLSAAEPEQALAAAAALPPAQQEAALGLVAASANRQVAQQRALLAAAPPQVARAPGVTTQAGPPPPTPSASTVRAAADRPTLTQPRPVPPPDAAPAPVDHVRPPAIPDHPPGQASPEAAQNVQSSIRAMPTSDPGLQVDPGATPRLVLAGDTDPRRVQEQSSHLEDATRQADAAGHRDAAAPFGEDHLAPTLPATTIRADVGDGAPQTAGSAPPSETSGPVGAGADAGLVSTIAQQEKGDEIRGAAASAAAGMARARAEHEQRAAAERERGREQVVAAERGAAAAQEAERAEAQAGVAATRREWSAEQAALVASHRAEAAEVRRTADSSVAAEQVAADEEAAAHHRTGAQEAAAAGRQGREEAERARRDGEQESSSGGFFSWAASAMRSLVDRVKNGIKAAFDKARAAARSAIEKAQQLATAVIDRARRAVVAAIQLAGTALIAIGDRLLAAFPSLRDRFRTAIQSRVRAAQAAVNRIADTMTRTVKAALDLVGRGLDAALGLMQRGMLAAVDAVRDAVKGALDFARKALDALGTFAVIAKDIGKGPGRWISMLGAAVVSGIRDHLWSALKTSIKQWFNGKVEEITGFGQAIWNLLTKGGISLAQVGRMVWQGIVAAIPGALIAILVEKLVSMIVPAAGAVLAIIQGIQAAWGAIQRVIEAISAFVAFLKGVLSGNGPALFARALAASAVAVIEFVAQWLLRKLKGAATKVGGKLRGIAQRIGARLRSIGRAAVSGGRRAAGAAVRAVRAVGRGIARGARAVGRGVARGARWVAARTGRFGAAAGRGLRRVAAAVRRKWEQLKAKLREWREKLKKKWEEWKKKRRERAEGATVASISAALDRGSSDLMFRGRLAYLKLRWGWSQLHLDRGGGQPRVMAAMSPLRPLPVPTMEHSVLVSSDLVVNVKSGGTARIAVGEGQSNPAVAAAAGRVRAMSAARYGQPGDARAQNAGAPTELESAGRTHYLTTIAPTEGIAPGSVSPVGQPVRTPWSDPTSKRRGGRAGLGDTVPDVGWGERQNAGGQLDLISIPEVSMVGHWGATGMLTKYGQHKEAQLIKYLAAAKMKIAQLQAQGKAIANVEVHIHYISDSAPSQDTIDIMERHLKAAGLPNLTVIWGRI